MTDEEMAEEYTKGLCKTCTVDICRYNIFQTCAIKESIKQAHLAGLKAGRPKWHKVADGDLPNENVKLILVRDRFDNKFLNYHLLLKKMIVEMIDQFDEWIELPIEE